MARHEKVLPEGTVTTFGTLGQLVSVAKINGTTDKVGLTTSGGLGMYTVSLSREDALDLSWELINFFEGGGQP